LPLTFAGYPAQMGTADVMVFAPSCLLTATVERRGQADDLHVHAGGQGVWQARMVTLLGARVIFCTVLGGEIGRLLEPLLLDEGFEVRAVRRANDTGWYVHDRRQGGRHVIADNVGSPLDRHDIDELYSLALTEGLRTTVSILGGPHEPSLAPANAYRRLVLDLTNNGSIVVADLSREHLSAALAGGPSVVKVAHTEILRTGRATQDSVEALARAAVGLGRDGARNVVISRAEQPAVALLDGKLVLVEPPRIEAADPRGAGDSMTAGIATTLARGGDIRTAVRIGAAAGAVNVSRHGLGTGHADAIAELATRVKLAPIDWLPA
jgi:1-phosphofructokinase